MTRPALPARLALMLACATLIVCGQAKPAAAQRSGDAASTDPVILLEERLCANAYLRLALQDQMSHVGERENGARRLLSCFREPGERVRAREFEVLTALDVACPGADVVSWVQDPATLPDRGCGETYTQPDFGVTPVRARP